MATLQRQLALNYPGDEAARTAPSATTSCDHNGDSVMGNFGPDNVVLVPASDRGEAADLQRKVGRLTYYFLCTRPRVVARDDCRVVEKTAEFRFDVYEDGGGRTLIERIIPKPPWLQGIGVSKGGVALELDTGRETWIQNASFVAQLLTRTKPWAPSIFDLDVQYIGRARGVVRETCALDRLAGHEKYQRVLEDILASPHRNREVWLFLGAGVAMDLIHLRADGLPDLPPGMLRREVSHARSTMSESRRIDVTEALMINYFKPPLNDHHTGALDLSSRTFKHCYDAGLTGLQLVMSTHELHVALYTAHRPAQQWHVETVCLY